MATVSEGKVREYKTRRCQNFHSSNAITSFTAGANCNWCPVSKQCVLLDEACGNEEKPITGAYKCPAQEKILGTLMDPELSVYITLACIPFMRTLAFSVLLADTQKHFGPRDVAAMAILFAGHLVRAQADSSDLGHVDSVCPTYIKVFLVIADVLLCKVISHVRKRVNKELKPQEKEDFIYYLLPSVFAGEREREKKIERKRESRSDELRRAFSHVVNTTSLRLAFACSRHNHSASLSLF